MATGRGEARAGAHQKVATDSGFSCPDADITDAVDILDIADIVDIRRLAWPLIGEDARCEM